MKLSELIARYGDEAVVFQKLDDCTTSLSLTKHGSKATFVTPERFGLNGFEKLGLIVWLDRGKAADVVAQAKAEANDAP